MGASVQAGRTKKGYSNNQHMLAWSYFHKFYTLTKAAAPDSVCVADDCAPQTPTGRHDDPPAQSKKSSARAKCDKLHKCLHHNTLQWWLGEDCGLGSFVAMVPACAPTAAGMDSSTYLSYMRSWKWLFTMWYEPEFQPDAIDGLKDDRLQEIMRDFNGWWEESIAPAVIQAQNILVRAGKSNKLPPTLFGGGQVLQVLQHLVGAAHFQPPSKLQPWLQKIMAEYDYPDSAGKCHGWPADQLFATNAAGLQQLFVFYVEGLMAVVRGGEGTCAHSHTQLRSSSGVVTAPHMCIACCGLCLKLCLPLRFSGHAGACVTEYKIQLFQQMPDFSFSEGSARGAGNALGSSKTSSLVKYAQQHTNVSARVSLL